MHGPAYLRTGGSCVVGLATLRTLERAGRSARTIPLEDRLAALNTARTTSVAGDRIGRSSRSRWRSHRRRSGINRPRAGLRHNHATRRRGRQWCAYLFRSTHWRDSSSRRSCGCSSIQANRSAGDCSASGWSARDRSNDRNWRLRLDGSDNCAGRWSVRRWSLDDRRGRHRSAHIPRCRGAGRLHRRPGNHRSGRRLRRNCWYRRRGRDHNPRLLPGLRHNPPRSRRSDLHRGDWSLDLNRRNRGGGNRRRKHSLGRSRYRRSRSRRSSRGRRFFFPPQNFAHGIARLRHLRPVNLRLLPVAAGITLRVGTSTESPLQIGAHTFGLIAFERTRMGLLFGYANRGQSIQDLPTLDFQFTRQIINSNFTHPPL